MSNAINLMNKKQDDIARDLFETKEKCNMVANESKETRN